LLEEKLSVFIGVNNKVVEEALKRLFGSLGFPLALTPETAAVAVVDGTKVADPRLWESGRAKVLLLDTGLTNTQLYFLVKNFPLSGIISPDMESSYLSRCLKAVVRGEKWFKRDFLVSAGKEGVNLSNLTDRELKVIEFLIEGKTNKEIARELGVTEQTVKYYVNQLLKKTNCTNRVKLVCFFSQILPFIKGRTSQ